MRGYIKVRTMLTSPLPLIPPFFGNCGLLTSIETRDAQANGEFTRGNNASDGGEKDTKGMGEEMSEEMRKKNRTFHRDHQMCIHLNVVTVLAVLWYGVRLAWRFDVQS